MTRKVVLPCKPVNYLNTGRSCFAKNYLKTGSIPHKFHGELSESPATDSALAQPLRSFHLRVQGINQGINQGICDAGNKSSSSRVVESCCSCRCERQNVVSEKLFSSPRFAFTSDRTQYIGGRSGPRGHRHQWGRGDRSAIMPAVGQSDGSVSEHGAIEPDNRVNAA